MSWPMVYFPYILVGLGLLVAGKTFRWSPSRAQLHQACSFHRGCVNPAQQISFLSLGTTRLRASSGQVPDGATFQESCNILLRGTLFALLEASSWLDPVYLLPRKQDTGLENPKEGRVQARTHMRASQHPAVHDRNTLGSMYSGKRPSVPQTTKTCRPGRNAVLLRLDKARWHRARQASVPFGAPAGRRGTARSSRGDDVRGPDWTAGLGCCVCVLASRAQQSRAMAPGVVED